MKRSSLKDKIGEDEPSIDDQMKKAIADAFSGNDKVIEIRPARRSKGIGLKRLLLIGAVAIGLAYWVRKSQRPNDLIESAKGKTSDQIHQAAETIDEGSEAASERIEAGSERAGEAVQEVGEEAAEQTEEAGEEAAEWTEEAGEEAEADSGSSGT
jgi:cytoskeletal protein RodZ